MAVVHCHRRGVAHRDRCDGLREHMFDTWSCTLCMNTGACATIGHQVGERDGCQSETICHQAH